MRKNSNAKTNQRPKSRNKSKNILSHHDLFPGEWMRGEMVFKAERRIYPNLSQLDRDKDWC
jgi:hypothetical protein